MITPHEMPISTPYSPLAVQFMTQGQMGYMPDAQYLTPASYGAFRTPPPMDSPAGVDMDPGILHSYLIRNRGSIFGLPAYTFNTYNPAVNQNQYIHHITRRSYDSFASMGATAADFGMNMGISGLAMAAFGGFTPLGLAAGAASGMLLPDMSSPFVDRVRDTRAIQNLTTRTITSERDVNTLSGTGLSASAAGGLGRFLRQSAVKDSLLSEGDYKELYKQGLESGLMNFAGNARQQKEIIKKLRGNLTTFMEVLGSTEFKESMKDMKRLQDMGASISDMKGIIRKENAFSRMAGIDHASMANTFGQQGAFIFSRYGLDNYQGSLESQGNVAALTIAQRQGLISASTLSRNGGISGMAQAMTEQSAAMHGKMKDAVVSYFMNGSGTGIDESRSIEGVLNSANPLQELYSGALKITDPSVKANFDKNKDELYSKLMKKFGAEALEGMAAMAAGKAHGFTGKEAMYAGFKYGYGMSAEIAEQKANKLYSRDFRENMEREALFARKKAQEEYDLYNSPLRRMGRSVMGALNTLAEGTFGQAANAYTQWQEANERRKAGLKGKDTGQFDTSTGGAITGEVKKSRLGGMAGTTVSAMQNIVDNVGVIKSKYDTYDDYKSMMDQVKVSLIGETRDFNPATTNARFFKGSDGKWRNNRGDFVDKGGLSFGAIQVTTDNMMGIFKKDTDLREAYRKAGLTDEVLERVSSAQAKLHSLRKFSELTSDDNEALAIFNNAHKSVMQDTGMREKFEMHSGELGASLFNTYAKNAGKVDAGIAGKMFGSSLWQSVMYGTSIRFGGSGAKGVFENFVNNLKRNGVTSENFDEVMKSKEGALKILEMYRKALEAKSPGERYSENSEEQRAMRAMVSTYADMQASPEAAAALKETSEAESRAEDARAMHIREAFRSTANGSAIYNLEEQEKGTVGSGMGGVRSFANQAIDAASGEDAMRMEHISALYSNADEADAARNRVLSAVRKNRGTLADMFNENRGRSHQAWRKADDILRDIVGKETYDNLTGKDRNLLMRDVLAAAMAEEKGMGANDRRITASAEKLSQEYSRSIHESYENYMKKRSPAWQEWLNKDIFAGGDKQQAIRDLVAKDDSLANIFQIGLLDADRAWALGEGNASLAKEVRRALESSLSNMGYTKKQAQGIMEALTSRAGLDDRKVSDVAKALGRSDTDNVRKALALGRDFTGGNKSIQSARFHMEKSATLMEGLTGEVRREARNSAMGALGIAANTLGINTDFTTLHERPEDIKSLMEFAKRRGDKNLPAVLEKALQAKSHDDRRKILEKGVNAFIGFGGDILRSSSAENLAHSVNPADMQSPIAFGDSGAGQEDTNEINRNLASVIGQLNTVLVNMNETLKENQRSDTARRAK